MSNWTVSKVYLYVLSLITFSVLLFNFVSLTNSIPGLISPEPGWATDYISSRNELFSRRYSIWPDVNNEDHATKLAGISEADVEEFIAQREQEMLALNRDNHIRNIIRNGFSFVILLPVHIYFFVLARKSDKLDKSNKQA